MVMLRNAIAMSLLKKFKFKRMLEWNGTFIKYTHETTFNVTIKKY